MHKYSMFHICDLIKAYCLLQKRNEPFWCQAQTILFNRKWVRTGKKIALVNKLHGVFKIVLPFVIKVNALERRGSLIFCKLERVKAVSGFNHDSAQHKIHILHQKCFRYFIKETLLHEVLTLSNSISCPTHIAVVQRWPEQHIYFLEMDEQIYSISTSFWFGKKQRWKKTSGFSAEWKTHHGDTFIYAVCASEVQEMITTQISSSVWIPQLCGQCEGNKASNKEQERNWK